MATDTHAQAKALAVDLAKAASPVNWQVGKLVNALVEQAKKEHPDNVALATVDPLTTDGDAVYVRNANADAVRAIVGQLVAATTPPRRGPSIA